MKSQGLTLLELLISLTIVSIILLIGVPTFSHQMEQARTQRAMSQLRDAIETTRSTAVFRNTRATLQAKNAHWEDGWVLFVDENHNGEPDEEETILLEGEALPGIKTSATSPMHLWVSFIGTGEGRRPTGTAGGAFLTGTITLCAESSGEGYKLVLSRGGRTRVAPTTPSDCASL